MEQRRSHEHLVFETGGLIPPPERLRKVLVVGAGVAGLQTARQLRRLGVQVLVLEANDDIGGVWIRNYIGFGLQVPWRMYQFPEFPWPKDLQPSSDYPTGQEVQEYVRAYCREFNLKRYIRFNCKLLRLRWCPGTRQWDALYCDAYQEKFFKVTVDYAVICAGIYSQPYIPDYEGTDSYAGIQLHAKDFVDLSLARGRRVVIVGAGKTALDCVSSIVATNTATSVTLLYRQAHWPLPRRMLGMSVRRLLFNRAMTTTMPPYYTAGPAMHAANSVMGPLKKLFWGGLQAVISHKFRITEQMRPRVHLPADLFYGGQILDNTMDKLIRSEALVTVKGEINRFVRNGVILQDGNFVAADLVLYCTGYLKTYDCLEGDMRSRLDLQKDGLYLYRNCLPYAVPHLAFIGSEVSTYNNILTHGLQALWLAHVLTGRVRLPTPAAMAEDVRAQQRWRRAIMPAQRSRGSVLMLYMMQYHDQLLEDMGQPSRRKGLNFLAECFGAYTASDYRSLLTQDKMMIPNVRRQADEQHLAVAGVAAALAAAGPPGAAGAAAAGGSAGGNGGALGASGSLRTSRNGMSNGRGDSGASVDPISMRYGSPHVSLIDERLVNSRAATSVSTRSVLHDNDDLYGVATTSSLHYNQVLVPSGSAAAAVCRVSSRTSASVAEGSPYRVSEADGEIPEAAAAAAIADTVTAARAPSSAAVSPKGNHRSSRAPSSTADGVPIWVQTEAHRRSARALGARVSADMASAPRAYERPTTRSGAGGDGGGSGSILVASAASEAGPGLLLSQHWSATADGGGGRGAACLKGDAGDTAVVVSAPTPVVPLPELRPLPSSIHCTSSPFPSHPSDLQTRDYGLVWPVAPFSGAQADHATGEVPRSALNSSSSADNVPPACAMAACAGALSSSIGAVGCRSFTSRGSVPEAAIGGAFLSPNMAALGPSSPSRLSRHTGPSSPLPRASLPRLPPPPPQQPQNPIPQQHQQHSVTQDGAVQVQHVHWSLESEDALAMPNVSTGGNEAGGRPMARQKMAKPALDYRSAPARSSVRQGGNGGSGRSGGSGSYTSCGFCGPHCPCCAAGGGQVASTARLAAGTTGGGPSFSSPGARSHPPCTTSLFVEVPRSGGDSGAGAAGLADIDEREGSLSCSPREAPGCGAAPDAWGPSLRDAGDADLEGLEDIPKEEGLPGFDGRCRGTGDRGDCGLGLMPTAAAAATAGAFWFPPACGNGSCGNGSCGSASDSAASAHSPGSRRDRATRAFAAAIGAAVADPAPLPSRDRVPAGPAPELTAAADASGFKLNQRIRSQGNRRDCHGAACGGFISSSDRSHRLSSCSRSGSSTESSGCSDGNSNTANATNGSSGGCGKNGWASLASPRHFLPGQHEQQQGAYVQQYDSTAGGAAAVAPSAAAAEAAAASEAAAPVLGCHTASKGSPANDSPNAPEPGQDWGRDRDSPPPPPLLLQLPSQLPRPSAPNLTAANGTSTHCFSPWHSSAIHVPSPFFGVAVASEQTVGSPGSAASLSHWTAAASVSIGRLPALLRPSVEGLRPPPLSRLPEEDGGEAGRDDLLAAATAGRDRPSPGAGAFGAGLGARRAAAAAASLQRAGSAGAGGGGVGGGGGAPRRASGGGGNPGSRNWRRLALGLLSADGGPSGVAGVAPAAAESGSWHQLFLGAASTGSSGVLLHSSVSLGLGLGTVSSASVQLGPLAPTASPVGADKELLPRQPSPSRPSNHTPNSQPAHTDHDPSSGLGNWAGQAADALSTDVCDGCAELALPSAAWNHRCDPIAESVGGTSVTDGATNKESKADRTAPKGCLVGREGDPPAGTSFTDGLPVATVADVKDDGREPPNAVQGPGDSTGAVGRARAGG